MATKYRYILKNGESVEAEEGSIPPEEIVRREPIYEDSKDPPLPLTQKDINDLLDAV